MDILEKLDKMPFEESHEAKIIILSQRACIVVYEAQIIKLQSEITRLTGLLEPKQLHLGI